MDAIMRILIEERQEEEETEDLRLERIFLRDRNNPFHLPNSEFKRLFRLSKDLMQNLIEELTPHMNEGLRNTKISIPLRVLAIVHFLGTGHYQRGVGSNFNIGIAQQTVSKYLPEVCNAIQTIAPRWIQFPNTEDAKRRIKEGFMHEFGFPGVIGVIDGTQIRIDEPLEDEHIYFNRKGYHAKNVQIICDSNLNILNVNANFGGAAHDSFIWSVSAVRTILEANYRVGDVTSWLIGDSGYPLEPWLLTPIRNTREGTPERRFDERFAVARNCIERCIGTFNYNNYISSIF